MRAGVYPEKSRVENEAEEVNYFRILNTNTNLHLMLNNNAFSNLKLKQHTNVAKLTLTQTPKFSKSMLILGERFFFFATND